MYIFLFTFQVFWAQNTFEKGNQLYQKGNYKTAISNYETVLASGQQSAELYFNLANCYYKLHKVAPAIYNYEKALQLNPNDQEIKTNLEFAQKMAIDDIKVIPNVGFNKIIEEFTNTYFYDTWAWISVLLAFLFFAFFGSYYFSKTSFQKRIFFTGMFVILIAIVISIASAIYEKNRIINEKAAIIFSETSSLKTEPKASSSQIILLHEGTKVYIVENIANWKKVQLTDETTGWISDQTIKELR